MSTNRTALFLGLTGAQRMEILRKRARAEAEARELACRATYDTSAEEPVPAQLVQWGKNLRRDQTNLVRQLLLYVENGKARNMVVETRQGIEQMLKAVRDYTDAVLPAPQPQLVAAMGAVASPIALSGRSRAIRYDRPTDTTVVDDYPRPMGAA